VKFCWVCDDGVCVEVSLEWSWFGGRGLVLLSRGEYDCYLRELELRALVATRLLSKLFASMFAHMQSFKRVKLQ
jgi:hypothetical protein